MHDHKLKRSNLLKQNKRLHAYNIKQTNKNEFNRIIDQKLTFKTTEQNVSNMAVPRFTLRMRGKSQLTISKTVCDKVRTIPIGVLIRNSRYRNLSGIKIEPFRLGNLEILWSRPK